MNQEINPDIFQAHRDAIHEIRKDRGKKLVEALFATLKSEVVKASSEKQPYSSLEIVIAVAIFVRNVCCNQMGGNLRVETEALEKGYALAEQLLPHQCLHHKLARALAQLQNFCRDANSMALDMETESDLRGLQQ